MLHLRRFRQWDGTIVPHFVSDVSTPESDKMSRENREVFRAAIKEGRVAHEIDQVLSCFLVMRRAYTNEGYRLTRRQRVTTWRRFRQTKEELHDWLMSKFSVSFDELVEIDYVQGTYFVVICLT